MKNHLGGHGNICHTDEGILDYFIENHGVRSFIDIGCGTGEMALMAYEKGLRANCVDGDDSIDRNIDCVIHDFTEGSLKLAPHDLSWCVEFLEHVKDIFIHNFMSSFNSKFIVVTHALPGKNGHHHVNCQYPDYWIRIFNGYGYKLDDELTQKIKSVSTMKREFIQNTGLCFRR